MQRTMLRQFALLLLCLWPGMMAMAGSVHIQGPFGSVNVPARSLEAMRWDRVIPQQYDYSCGAAAVATLLTFHYQRPTTEAEVFEHMIATGDVEQIQAQGFSMLDMKRYLDGQGLNADGFRVSLEDLARIGVPAITLINTGGYRHFVVIKGIDENNIVVADPAVGTVIVPTAHFANLWSGTVLGARADMLLAQQNFNHERDWRLRARAPKQQAIRRMPMSSLILNLPAHNEMGR
ncbi:C39 family peptidase [Franzmannia qiaohouensis]|uniref:C39 family peptidase n=1 Tax=Franzmannia qiaohouensis TaxID=1329370 RepID=A0ABU1HA77_9GAMM|nr:C39 family peptidase [Halomonas qiaohouensis]MDR5903923.1 C39 family peptidase [Halomonas qiaohouensis]